MSIDWTHFSALHGLAGGALIGLASVLLMLVAGRIAGISGILGGLLAGLAADASKAETLWRLAFVLGLLYTPLLYRQWDVVGPIHVEAGRGTLIAAGLLVGFGTRLAGGCTSGHGVCGLSRLSARSLAAVGVFMATGFATVALTRHLLA
ncbi:MAG: YeeE/YedE family protein [Rhodocyclaceae bacterium]|nr:YeeE/YedE family protein [Rhodocyclaceae bacterium]